MSATLIQARERIHSTFVTDWGTTSPFGVDNEKFVPPTPASDWVRVTIRHNARDQVSLGDVGNRKFDSGGTVFVQCFTALDIGLKAAHALANLARNIFEGKTLTPESIRFTDVVVREIGADKGWYQVNVEATFNYEETK